LKKKKEVIEIVIPTTTPKEQPVRKAWGNTPTPSNSLVDIFSELELSKKKPFQNNEIKKENLNKYQIVDIGPNLTKPVFKSDFKQVIDRAIQNNVFPLIVTGTSLRESAAAANLCKTKNDKGILYCTVGIHPHDSKEFNENALNELKELASNPNNKVVAIGETGLDYNRMFSTKEEQILSFERHVQLACDLKLPLFLHEREAHKDFISIIEKYRSKIVNGVVHCFTGNAQEIEAYMKLNLHIGFTGVITNKTRGKELRDILSSKKNPIE